MLIESSIRSIRVLADVPTFVAALGHESLWEAIPPEGWNRQSQDGARLMAVGRTGSVPWFAFESRTPERSAARLAGRLSRRGRVSMVLALNPELRRLAFAVGFDKIARLEVDLERPEAEALASIARLAGSPAGGPLAFAIQAADALSAEPVGRRFFREFRSILEQMASGLPGPMPHDDRHALALLQLTRVLFLYFIQAKGWLDGRERFLSEQVDRCLTRGRRIHQDLLRPLFFGTLNQARSDRSRTAASFGAIPFLNGGLFEPHPVERRYRTNIPNHLWQTAFDRLFERFHFTVVEGVGGKIAPDMLGRVFEGVMAPDLRHTSGTFYTPASLVRRVVNAALIALLSQRLKCSESEAERRLQSADADTREVLGSVRVLDPAVGSGAFLLGTLEALARIGPATLSAAVRKRKVLESSLFGVDLNPSAVRLAELRLWLAVVADDPADQARDVRPLPNLDCLIRQGDSLFDPLGQLIGRPVHPAALRNELTTLRRELVTATGQRKQWLVRRLRVVESDFLSGSLEWAEHRCRAEIAAIVQVARGSDLFGERRGLDPEGRSALREFRRRLEQVRQARRRLLREGGLHWFHYQSHFADVFAHGGFDLVVGNPPWLRSEQISPVLRQQLIGRYRWWRGGKQRFGKGPDLSVAFIERGLELTGSGGILAMLVPVKIASTSYGTAARHALAISVTLHVVADLTSELTQEFDALVYPMAIVAGKTSPGERQRVRTSLELREGLRLPQAKLRGGQPWILVKDRQRSVISALESVHPRLGDHLVCHLGVKTGANRLFLNPPADLEPELIRRAIRGRDIRAFCCRAATRLLWTHDDRGRVLHTLPPKTAAYLRAHIAALRSRSDYQSGAPWTLFRVPPSFARYRVIWPDLARQLTAAALTSRRDRRLIPLNTCYVTALRHRQAAHSLAAWLNSTWSRAAARMGAVPAASGFARFNAQTIARLPLPASVLADHELCRIAREGRTGPVRQEALDHIAAQHLGLSSTDQSALHDFLHSSTSNRR
jgi:Eco57I restriction-modification methylase